jgi:tetratricopeptide (TPR) repeat protein
MKLQGNGSYFFYTVEVALERVKKYWLHILLSIGIASLSGCLTADRNKGGLPDQEVRLLQKAEAYATSHPDSSLLFADSLLKESSSFSDSLKNSLNFLRIKSLYFMGKRDSVLQLLPGLKSACKLSNDTLNWLRTENLTGMAFMQIGQTERAIAHTQSAYQLAVHSGHTIHQAKALVNLANIHSEKNELVKSQGYLQKALWLTKACDSLALLSEVTSSISHNFKLLGMMDSALHYGYKAVAIADRLQIPVHRINSYNNMGMLYKRLQPDSALHWLNKSLRLDPGKLQPRFNLINVYADQGQWSVASGLIDTLLTECRMKGSGPGVTRCLWQKAYILSGQGKNPEAIPLLREAIQIGDSLGIRYITQIARETEVGILQEMGRSNEARALSEIMQRNKDSLNRREKMQAVQLVQQYEEAERMKVRLTEEQMKSNNKLRNRQQLIGLLAGLLAALGMLFLLYRTRSRKRRAELMRQLETYREEVTRWESRIGQSDEEEISLLEQLIRLLEQEKPWLNAELRMEDLIEMLQCSRNALFAELKDAHIPGLTHLVQQYRVKEAVRLLEDPAYRNIKLEVIAAESGFGSYRSFHRSFEQITGLSPARYRRRVEEANLVSH